MTVPPPPKATDEESVPVKVRVLLTVNVFPSATVSVELVTGAVIVTLFILVAVATPRLGVVRDGLVANTSAPEPVSSVTAAARFALDGVARNVPTPEPRPDRFDAEYPVQFVKVPDDGVPRTGVTSVGLVAKTSAPEPVSSVIALIRLALEGVARTVATPVPNPLIPVETGRPVQLVRVPDEGVPRAPPL